MATVASRFIAPRQRSAVVMSGQRNACTAIREIWKKEAKRLWNDRTHGQGLCLLIVDILASIPGTRRSPSRSFEFWRDQNKIRGRFIGDAAAAGFVVARLDGNGLPKPE
jgi:hypothetical protein